MSAADYNNTIQLARPWLAGVCAGISSGLGLDVAWVRAEFLVAAGWSLLWALVLVMNIAFVHAEFLVVAVLSLLSALVVVLYIVGRLDGLRGIRSGETVVGYHESQSLRAFRFAGHVVIVGGVNVWAIAYVCSVIVQGNAAIVLWVIAGVGMFAFAYRYLQLRKMTDAWTTVPPNYLELAGEFQRRNVAGWRVAMGVVAVFLLIGLFLSAMFRPHDDADDDWGDWGE